MNELIDSPLLIDKYFELINEFFQCVDEGKKPYMVAQVFQKEHHAVLAFWILVDAFKEQRNILRTNKRGLGSIFFADEYHDLKLPQEAECKTYSISQRERYVNDWVHSLHTG